MAAIVMPSDAFFVVRPTIRTTTKTNKQQRIRTTTTKLWYKSRYHPADHEEPRYILATKLYRAFEPPQEHKKKKKEIQQQLDRKQHSRRVETLSKVKGNQQLTTILSSWANSKAKDAAERSYLVLDHIRQHPETNEKLHPNTFLYNVVMNAYARRRRADKAEQVLREMMRGVGGGGGLQDHNNNKDTDVETEVLLSTTMPTVISFSTVISAYAKSSKRFVEAPDKCLQLLQDMQSFQGKPGWEDVGPDVVTYNSVIGALARHGRPEEAEQVLRQEMLLGSSSKREEQGGGGGVLPDVISFNLVMHGWLRKANNKEDDEQQQQDKASMAACEEASRVAPARCDQLYQDLQDLGRWTGAKEHRPNRMTHAVLIEIHANHGKPQDAERVLWQVLESAAKEDEDDVEITAEMFHAVIDAWSSVTSAKDDDAPDRCMKLYEEMKRLAEEEDMEELRPTSEVQRKVIAVFGKHGRKKEATDKMWWKIPTMEELRQLL